LEFLASRMGKTARFRLLVLRILDYPWTYASSMHGFLYLYRTSREACILHGMEKQHIPIYLPTAIVARIDGVAHAEMRTRTNATAWLVSQALRSRELAEAEARSEAS
jgi:hypothetical protein